MVVGATGHQNIPDGALLSIRDELRRTLRELSELEGVCSLAAGADQLFAQTVLDCGGKLRVVVPSMDYEQTFGTRAQLETFSALLGRAADVERLEFSKPSEAAFFAAGRRVVDRCELLLAVWDGEPARGLGGTADVVKYAEDSGKKVLVIWPEGLVRG